MPDVPLSGAVPGKLSHIVKNGGAGRIRTADTQFRKLLLYPSELQPLDGSLTA